MRASRILLTITAAAAAAGICFALPPALDRPAPEPSPAAASAVLILRPGASARRMPGTAALRVTDAQGVNVLEMSDGAAAPTDVRLPAGHYRVSARFSGPPRSETVEVLSDQELATR
jgi:hypothetical protein